MACFKIKQFVFKQQFQDTNSAETDETDEKSGKSSNKRILETFKT